MTTEKEHPDTQECYVIPLLEEPQKYKWVCNMKTRVCQIWQQTGRCRGHGCPMVSQVCTPVNAPWTANFKWIQAFGTQVIPRSLINKEKKNADNSKHLPRCKAILVVGIQNDRGLWTQCGNFLWIRQTRTHVTQQPHSQRHIHTRTCELGMCFMPLNHTRTNGQHNMHSGPQKQMFKKTLRICSRTFAHTGIIHNSPNQEILWSVLTGKRINELGSMWAKERGSGAGETVMVCAPPGLTYVLPSEKTNNAKDHLAWLDLREVLERQK